MSSNVAIEIFYSYAQQDEALRLELEKHLSLLQRQHIIVGWHRRMILPGTELTQAIDKHLNTAHIILLLISADFLASDYCYGIEMERALERHKTGEACVIPIILRPVDWENAPFSGLQALPTGDRPVTTWSSSPPYDEAFLDIARGIRNVLEGRKEGVPSPHSQSPLWNIPYRRNSFFTGRDELLERLHDNLMKNKTTALTQPQAISGLGGIGKTQIAVEYIYRYQEEYLTCLWVNATTRNTLITSFLSMATILGLPTQQTLDQNKVIVAVKDWFTSHKNWLLIFDNADDLTLADEFLPTSNKGHVLLTTRAFAVGGIAMGVEVERMNTDVGVQFLLRRAKILSPDASIDKAPATDRTAAEAIVKEMGGLPLALDQAGAYIEETQCSIPAYLEQFIQHQEKLLQRRGMAGQDHPEPVATTWFLSFAQVEELNPIAADLLRFCAYLAPDAIPEEMILDGAAELDVPLRSIKDDPFLLHEAIGVLLRFSLIQRNRLDRTLSIHRLVQAVFKASMNLDMRQQWAEKVIRAVERAFPRVSYATWPRCQRLLASALVCADLINQYSFTFPEAAQLLNQIGLYLGDHARYTEAEPFYQRAFTIRKKVLGPSHPATATSINNLAFLYKSQGKYPEAKPLYEQALAIREKELGPSHPATASSLNNLALLYISQGDYTKAEPLLKRAMAIKEKELGLSHPSTATTLNNLAELYSILRKYDQAEPLLLRALSIWENEFGTFHPDTATTLNNLAGLYNSLGRYTRAEELYLQALDIRKEELGPLHPDTASSLNNLALFYKNQGRHAEAEPLYEQALDIREKMLGRAHPDTAQSLNNLALLYQGQDRYTEAEPLLKEALAIRKKVLGQIHSDTAQSLNNLALLYQGQGKYSEAEPLLKEALAIREQVLGSTHPNTKSIRENHKALQRIMQQTSDLTKTNLDTHTAKREETWVRQR